MRDTRFSKVVLFINALVPLTLMLWDWAHHRLGVNPIEFVTRTTGVLTLVFLLLTLTITPLRLITGKNWLIKFRRMLGLFAFFYVCLHFITYLAFDRGFKLLTIPGDIIQRPFVAIGMASFFMLIPLAVTSTKGWIKRLGGKGWASLHRLIYPAAIGGVLHYYLIVKSDIRYPLAFAIVLAALLGYRIYHENRSDSAPARTLS
ncbi:MAG: protein-methionine-sulfoxide reductase heme-binding subunit MsrQ [Pyrinomonadaceae bacterium]